MKFLLVAFLLAGAGLLFALPVARSVRAHVSHAESSARQSLEGTERTVTRGLESWEGRLASDLEDALDRLPTASAPALAPAPMPERMGWFAPAPAARMPPQPAFPMAFPCRDLRPRHPLYDPWVRPHRDHWR